MSTSTRVSLEQYHEMIRQGMFEPREEHRVELIHGEIVAMRPLGPTHNDIVSDLTHWSCEAVPLGAVKVRVQASITIAGFDSEPEPDLVWVRPARYRSRQPFPSEILLLIEVSDSSLAKDRGLKARLYAGAGIAEYWIVNISERSIEVHRDPVGSSYTTIEIVRAGQSTSPRAFPDAVLEVDWLFQG